jgi:hypothetical protein
MDLEPRRFQNEDETHSLKVRARARDLKHSHQGGRDWKGKRAVCKCKPYSVPALSDSTILPINLN